MAILVSGGAGYIGSHTCVELLEKGYGVVVIDNLVNSSAKSLERVEQITGKSLDFYQNDVRDRDAMERIFSKHDIDCVIHFAGLKAVGESVSMPLEYYDNNLYSTVVLCETMREHGVKNIVFSSSATVYSGDNTMPLRENSHTGMCTNPYGWTKYMCEQILRDTGKAIPDWSIALLRYFNPIGAHESGLIGEDPKGIPNNLVPYVAQVAVGKLAAVGVFGDDYPTPDGTCVRDYIHVKDLAEAHLLALEYLDRGGKSDVFNLGSGNGYSVREIIDTARRVTGREIPAKVEPRRAGDPSVLIASHKKAVEVLGWQPVRGLEEIISDAWAWHSGHPNGYEG